MFSFMTYANVYLCILSEFIFAWLNQGRSTEDRASLVKINYLIFYLPPKLVSVFFPHWSSFEHFRNSSLVLSFLLSNVWIYNLSERSKEYSAKTFLPDLEHQSSCNFCSCPIKSKTRCSRRKPERSRRMPPPFLPKYPQIYSHTRNNKAKVNFYLKKKTTFYSWRTSVIFIMCILNLQLLIISMLAKKITTTLLTGKLSDTKVRGLSILIKGGAAFLYYFWYSYLEWPGRVERGGQSRPTFPLFEQ